MPAGARREVVAKGEVGVYHCWNRCVQRALLCGNDPITGQDYDYRRDWVEQTEQLLARLFAVEVAFHAEMANHIHVILRSRPDLPQDWSDRAVVRRWLCITKLKRNGADSIVDPTDAEITRELERPGRVAELRRRLGDISWFMGALCECISRRCNADSGCSGAFWEHRFKCRSLADEAAILVCGTYVDLNMIRAREAATPERSRHTSAYNRIQGLQQRLGREGAASITDAPRPDGWLCELSLQDGLSVEQRSAAESASHWRASDKGILSISLEKYLQLLDWTGRQIHANKRGAIPAHLAPILDRLGINRGLWLDAIASFDQWFGRVVGSATAVTEAARHTGRRWLRGAAYCTQLFG